MKAGDLVVISEPRSLEGAPIGIIVDSQIIENKIAVLWPGDGEVSYEPIMFLEVLGQ